MIKKGIENSPSQEPPRGSLKESRLGELTRTEGNAYQRERRQSGYSRSVAGSVSIVAQQGGRKLG